MTEWSNKTVVLPQWDLWVWKICSLWQYYCRSLSALHPVSTAASVDCCGRMIDGRLFLMVREYGQLGQNNMETSAADLQQVRSHWVPFPTYLSNWDTYQCVSNIRIYITGSGSENTVHLAHRTPYCWGSRATRVMNPTIHKGYLWKHVCAGSPWITLFF